MLLVGEFSGGELAPRYHFGCPWEHWYLADREDVRSSFQCEVFATEFEIQGLELDWIQSGQAEQGHGTTIFTRHSPFAQSATCVPLMNTELICSHASWSVVQLEFL